MQLPLSLFGFPMQLEPDVGIGIRADQVALLVVDGIRRHRRAGEDPGEGALGVLMARARCGLVDDRGRVGGDVAGAEVGGFAEFLTDAGDLRTLPWHLPDADPRMAGLDGFYAARLVRWI